MLKQILISLVLISFISVSALAQEKQETKMEGHKMHMMNMQSDSSMNHEMKPDSTLNNSIVREGEIDLEAIDKNHDGKVFQDMMDWNVISDEPGTCPICEMTLKEVTLEEAKEYLIKFGFKVKGK